MVGIVRVVVVVLEVDIVRVVDRDLVVGIDLVEVVPRFEDQLPFFMFKTLRLPDGEQTKNMFDKSKISNVGLRLDCKQYSYRL